MDIRQPFIPLVPLAMKGLRAMCAPDGVFCQTARRGADGRLHPVGRSLRYTAMTAVGLAMQERLGNKTDLPLDRSCDELAAWFQRGAEMGDAGLVLWALATRRDGRAEQFGRQLTDPRSDERLRRAGSMALGWLLTGLGAAMEEGLAGKKARGLADVACDVLLSRQTASGLFRLGSDALRKNIFQWRINARLGSFASQVYPAVGLAYYGRAAASEHALQAATRTADILCNLQGPQGQWWWIYDAATGRPVVKYPVYSVHQDAMGPMALLAVSLADGAKDEYRRAVIRSVDWLEGHPEMSGASLVDTGLGVVWRAIQRDPPGRTGEFGLGRRDWQRMKLAAWTGRPDRRAFGTGYVCDECRPYHLGWILAADAMAAAVSNGTSHAPKGPSSSSPGQRPGETDTHSIK